MRPRGFVAGLLACAGLCAQTGSLSIGQAVEQSVARYPAMRGSLERVSEAAARIALARTSYLPKADVLAQVNRATRNNVFGLLLPQAVISPISGPVLGTNSLASVWGSAVGVLVSWEPLDFGLRRANVAVAESTRDRASAETAVTRLEVASAAAEAFLSIAAAEQTRTAAEAGAERARTVNLIVETLVKNELRAGAEASRSRAELAVAETQAIQARQNVAIARAALIELIGAAPDGLNAGALLARVPAVLETPRDLSAHPALQAQTQAIAEVKAREHALDRSYYPRLNLQGTTYARGAGNLDPNTQNWGVGLTVTFAALDLPILHARKRIEAYTERAEAARYDQLAAGLNAQLEKAKATLAAAQLIARNTPIELQAARDGERQALARYKAGLTNIVELAEAERLLTQAEIDDSLARLGVWRSLLGVAAASGDLTPFLTEAAK